MDPDPKSVGVLVDFIGRRYLEARKISVNQFTDLSLLNESVIRVFCKELAK